MSRPKKILPEQIPATPVKVENKQHNCAPGMFGTSYAGMPFDAETAASYYPYARSFDTNGVAVDLNYLKYNNLINRISPFNETNGFWSIRGPVLLCQTAWREVPVFNQTVETMTMLANTPLTMRGGSDDCKKFVKVWQDKINGFNLNEQLLRELFRSSNVFVYRYDGGIKSNKINKFVLGDESMAAKTINIPVKYEVLNPADISCMVNCSLEHGLSSYYRFFDVSSKQRLQKLQDNKELNIKLDEELVKLLSCDHSMQQLDADKLSVIFYHKQDYEPFAMPMGYPVLEDINLKLEFKKCDAVVAKTVESIIMLVKHGSEPDKGGMNPVVDAALKEVFRTKQTGRTLISDYTTEIEFVIPDLNKVIGPEKYLKIDQDINDGLMNIFFGDQKFANIMVKLRVFVAILTYAQEILVNEFISKEVKRVCKLVGYKEDEIPTVKFKKIQLEDPSQTHRIWAQLAQLGLLTAEETFDAVDTGLLPTGDDSVKSQEKYKKLRDKELYFPLIGGAKEEEGTAAAAPGGRPKGTGTKKKVVKPSFKGGSVGSFDPIKFKKNILLANRVVNEIELVYKEKFGRNKLEDKDKEIIKIISTHLIINEPTEKWMESIAGYLTDLPEINIENISVIEEIKEIQDMDDLTAGILLWSKN